MTRVHPVGEPVAAGASELLLVRHGQTEWNLAERVQGRLDSPLTDTGREQARRTGAWLAGLPPPDSFLVSPLGRTRDTADIIAAAIGVQPQVDERLAERCMGELQGLDLDQIRTGHQAFFQARKADPWHVAPAGGESHADVATRVQPLLQQLLQTPGRHLLVSHGIVTRVLVALAAGLGPDEGVRVRCPNDLVYRLRVTADGPQLGHVRAGGAYVPGWFAG